MSRRLNGFLSKSHFSIQTSQKPFFTTDGFHRKIACASHPKGQWASSIQSSLFRLPVTCIWAKQWAQWQWQACCQTELWVPLFGRPFRANCILPHPKSFGQFGHRRGNWPSPKGGSGQKLGFLCESRGVSHLCPPWRWPEQSNSQNDPYMAKQIELQHSFSK